MPTPAIDRVVHFVSLIVGNRRISITRLRKETGLSKSSVYRYIDAASMHLPIRREGGSGY